jgi:hypothetical protein
MQKTKTFDQVVATQQKAVHFLRSVVGDAEKADEFEAMSPDEYAAHKHLQIENPSSCRSQFRQRRMTTMAKRMTVAELQDRVTELEDENQDLQDRIDSIADIIEPGDSEEDDDGEEEDDESD